MDRDDVRDPGVLRDSALDDAVDLVELLRGLAVVLDVDEDDQVGFLEGLGHTLVVTPLMVGRKLSVMTATRMRRVYEADKAAG